MTDNFFCPIYKKCGGCQLDIPYPAQLSFKQRNVIRLLGRYCRVERIVGAEQPLHYRCKISTAYGFSRGQIISGIWQSSSGRIAKTDSCSLEDERAERIISAIKALMPKYKIKAYDERSGKGELRFTMIRIGRATGEILLAFGCVKKSLPSEKEFVSELVGKCPEITTVTVNLSKGLNLLLGQSERVVFGKGYITDTLCGCDFKISARSFFQVNPAQTEKLYSLAIELAELDGSESVIDAYCGVGTIGIIASKCAKSVLGVEQNPDAAANARENAKINGADNYLVVCADSGEFMQGLAQRGQVVDVVFTDPPRSGCSREFLSSLVSLAPKKIVYISCNPETLARDLGYLTKNGYEAKRAVPVDMFPYTEHCECVVQLEKQRLGV